MMKTTTKKLSVYRLTLEIGRFCDQECDHCLRGCRQNISMAKETITKTLEQIDRIGEFTFTGGEPFLYIEEIMFTLSELKRFGISVDFFFISTNGQHFSGTVLETIYALYEYCDEKDMFTIRISADQFHEELFNDRIAAWQTMSFVYYEDGNRNEDYLLQEGNADENGWNTGRFPQDDEVAFYEESCEVAEGNIYVNALGYVLFGCDYSYETQKSKAKGFIMDDTLWDIIAANADTIYPCEFAA